MVEGVQCLISEQTSSCMNLIMLLTDVCCDPDHRVEPQVHWMTQQSQMLHMDLAYLCQKMEFRHKFEP